MDSRFAIGMGVAIGLAVMAGAANAQYYPAPPPVVYGAPADPDDYVPAPPPGAYGRPPVVAPYPPEAPPPYNIPRVERQGLPAPAPGTHFPPPADYPWVRERAARGGEPAELREPPYPGAIPAVPGEPPRGSGHILPDGTVVMRPPGEVDTVAPGVAPRRPNSAVASLPPDYQPEEGQPKELPAHLRRQMVDYPTREPAGTLVIDTPNTYLYLVLGNGKAMRYGIGVGREGFTWAGAEKVSKMAEWPDWHPPKEMIERQPYLPRFMAGGDSNPLGARALYLGRTLYRIHGTNQPSTIGSFVSSGCIRLTNEDIQDLYARVQVGTRVVVMPGGGPSQGQGAAAAPTVVR